MAGMFIALLLFFAVVFFCFMVYLSIERKKLNQRPKIAYFSGGPLAGKTKHVPELPEVQVYEGQYVYRRQDLDGSRNAEYVYEGTLKDDGLIHYELEA